MNYIIPDKKFQKPKGLPKIEKAFFLGMFIGASFVCLVLIILLSL